MSGERAARAADFARQIVETCKPFAASPPESWEVLDVGCGYGHTAAELAKVCRSVTGIEPSEPLAREAIRLAADIPNLTIRQASVYDLEPKPLYDLIVLDNVFEHLPDQPGALAILSGCLRPQGVLYLLMPNKLWPMEVHYHLPFLSYLPLSWANRYLRWTGRGTDYTDASYAPTYWRLRRLLRERPELRFQFVLPANLAWTTAGAKWHYRLGVAALKRFPSLWAISKAFLVVAVKHG
ncbi:MAG: class I SAM-dependent methyltransferase [Gemmatales bacterium]|nr:class I SAM-dependent methyltransferase [Gemmatales bacterium]MDW8387887.1 class I SAM-dependent methyltransferase [Gemmatales bacterium]